MRGTISKVVLKGFIIVSSDDLSAVRCELINHQDLTRNETGCLVFEVVKSENNPNRFYVYEEIRDKAVFETHQARVKISN